MSARIESFAKQIMQAVPTGAKVLEVGAGEGVLAQTLATAGYEVIAVDRKQGSTFPTLICDFADYDAGSDTFDCVIASLVLHHAPDLEQMLVKMRALLKPGGIVAIDDYGWERLDEAPARARWGSAWESETQKWRAERVSLHRSRDMLSVLDRYFSRQVYYNHAYFDDGAGSDRLAFTFIGTPKLS